MQLQSATEEVGEPAGVPLSYYFRALRRWWWVATACAVLGVVAGFAYWWLAPTKVTATSAVSVNVISTDPFSSSRAASTLLDGAAEAQIAGSYIVAEAAAKDLSGDASAEEIRDSLEIQSVTDTTILRISSTMPTEKAAAATADAVAEAYLAFRSTQADERIQSSLAQSDARLQSLRDELRTVNEKLSKAKPGSAAATDAETDRALLNLEISSLLSQSASTENIDTTGGSVLNPATRNAVVYEPKQGVVAIAGLLGGLGLGVVLVFIMSALDKRVRDEEDVRRATGAPVLGSLSGLTPSIPPTGTELQEFRALRERIAADPRFDPRSGVYAIVDASAREASDVPVNLAFAFARSGLEVECVMLGASDAFMLAVLDAFDLSVVQDDHHGTRLSSESVSNFSVYVPATSDFETEDEYLPDSAQNEIESRSRNALVMLSVPADASLATRLTANRLSDATVIVATLAATQRRTLTDIAADAARGGKHLLGSLLIPRHRGHVAQSEATVGNPTKDNPTKEQSESGTTTTSSVG